MRQEFGQELKASTQAMECRVANLEQAMLNSKQEDVMQLEDINFLNQRGYNKNRGYQGQSSGNLAYHLNNRNHPNFPYSNANNALIPPLGFSVTNGVIDAPKKPNDDESMIHFKEKMETEMVEVRHLLVEMSKKQIMLQTRIGQMSQTIGAVHQPGKLPSDTMVNPKDHCNAIHFRSDSQYQGLEKLADSAEKLGKKARMATRTVTAISGRK